MFKYMIQLFANLNLELNDTEATELENLEFLYELF
jgi:hypothetical protein